MLAPAASRNWAFEPPHARELKRLRTEATTKAPPKVTPSRAAPERTEEKDATRRVREGASLTNVNIVKRYLGEFFCSYAHGGYLEPNTDGTFDIALYNDVPKLDNNRMLIAAKSILPADLAKFEQWLSQLGWVFVRFTRTRGRYSHVLIRLNPAAQ